MLATASSPILRTPSDHERGSSKSPRPHYENPEPKLKVRTQPAESSRAYLKSPGTLFPKPIRRISTRSLDSSSPLLKSRKKMVDVGTQYSPQEINPSPASASKTPITNIAGLHIEEEKGRIETETTTNQSQSAESKSKNTSSGMSKVQPPLINNSNKPHETIGTPNQTKRNAPDPETDQRPGETMEESPEANVDESPLKRLRPDTPAVHVMPIKYELCDTRDLVILISSMLMELIRYNDAIPLREGQLTRFHSRAPPGISVLDYLQRLTTHATLSPPILLSMVYYIDKLCGFYPAFTISSLTVHRFLITSATVASKGLSDSFWTNKLYARVGGVSLKELALLELEFLTRMQWRIAPQPEVLVTYYRSLIERNPDYCLVEEETGE